MREYKRPESVLVVVYTVCSHVLLLKRGYPSDFWQSVTGSMTWDETDPKVTAGRELLEETGLNAMDLQDCQCCFEFPITPPWHHRYAPGVGSNLEHLFSVCLPQPVIVRLNPQEHDAWLWLPRTAAAEQVASWTNRQAILSCVPSAYSPLC